MADESGAPSALAGIWERFMTPGLKVQYRPEENPETGEIEEVAQEYDFGADAFVKFIENFKRTFSERRMVLDDGNHRAADPGHIQPQDLAYYSGEAAVWGGQVVAFWDQFPDLPPPDPGQLLAQLQKKFPRATSPDGVWGYRREVTPLGERLLPNMHQLSPMFSMEDKDEEGNEIGPNISSISPVFVAHQNGTTLMSKSTRAAMGLPSSAGHAPRPLGDEKTMADKEEKKSDATVAPGGISPEMRKAACAKFSLPEGASDNEIMTAYFVADKMAAGPTAGDEDEEAKKKAAMSVDAGEKPGEIPAEANSSTNFGKVAPLLAQLGKRVETAEKAAADATAKLEAREKIEQASARTAFSKWARTDEGRWDDADETGLFAFLDDMGGDIDKAKAHISQHLPPRAAFARRTQGGHPIGTTTLKTAASDKSATFSKRTWEIYRSDPEISKMRDQNAAFAAAQRKARAEMPENYETWA